MVAERPHPGLIIAAFAALYVIWGSTYLAIALAVTTLPPFLMAGTRFVVAGTILFTCMRLRDEPRPTRRQWRSALVVGLFLLLGGNGGVCWAARWVPSGTISLMLATVPLWMAVLPWIVGKGPRPRLLVAIGIAIGLSGVALLSWSIPGGLDRARAIAIAVLFAAALAWAIGSLSSKRLPQPKSALMASSMQMLCGGLALLAVGLAMGEGSHFTPGKASATSWLALGYLIVFGAIVGFGAFVFLLRWSTPTRVATYAYVNPVVAVILGWALNGETVTWRTLAAGLLVIIAVVLIVTTKEREDAG
ncbi:MAG: EamA family transporter [Planctomycetes bacterium]|nr:EamA family transporter [Planctomycetota bacterium]